MAYKSRKGTLGAWAFYRQWETKVVAAVLERVGLQWRVRGGRGAGQGETQEGSGV